MSSEVAPNPSSSIFNQSSFTTTNSTNLDTAFLALNYLAYPTSQTATETIDSLVITQNNITINDMTLGSGANILSNNTAFGVNCLENATGNQNTAVGYHAGDSITSGTSNTAFGSVALQSSTSTSNSTAVGYSALGDKTSGLYNEALGSLALSNTSSGDDNVGIGYKAGYTNNYGNYNTFIGSEADCAGTNSDYSTAIGAGAQTSGSNKITLGTSADELLYYSPITPTYSSPSFGSGAIGETIINSTSGATTITTSATTIISLTITAGTWYIIGGVQISASSATTIAQISLDVGSSPTYFPSTLLFEGGYNSIRYITGSGSGLGFMQISSYYYTNTTVNMRLGGIASTGTYTIPTTEGYLRAIRIA